MSILVLSLALVAGCGGGSTATSQAGGGGSTPQAGAASSLTVASKVSVVDAGSSNLVSKVSSLKFFNKLLNLKNAIVKSGINPAGFASSSDYNTDTTDVYVQDKSVDAFKNVNQILCMMGQTKYDSMLNKGNYLALVDQNQCSSNQDSVSANSANSTNTSGSTNAPKYMTWTVNSSRADNNSPEVVTAWIHQPADTNNPPMVIYAKVTVTQGVSSTNPYGLFNVDFEGHPVNQDGSTNNSVIAMSGYLGTTVDSNGKVVLQYYENDGNGSEIHEAALNRSSDGSTGNGSVYSVDPWDNNGKPQQGNFAFNSNYFFRGADNNSGTCFDRTHFASTAWSYGLYDATGSRVNVNSGFPIVDANGDHGWIGYWGLWFDNSGALANATDGMALTEQSYNNGTTSSAQYHLFLREGRLTKYTKKKLTLADITNVPLNYFDQNSNTQIQVSWNGSAFVETAIMNSTTNFWDPTNSQADLPDLSSMQWTQLSFYSQALNGNVNVMLMPPPGDITDKSYCSGAQPPFTCSPDNTTPVIYFAQSMVMPGDSVPSTLACMNQCPDPSQINNATASDVNFPDSWQPQSSPTATYTFDSNVADGANAMLLVNGASPIVQTVRNQNMQQGVNSGPLFDPNPANLAALACGNWAPGKICSGQVWTALDTFYQWQTGKDQWDWLTGLLDSNGNMLKFDSPLNVKYVGDGTNGNLNTTYILDYDGFGQLNGIPGTCYDDSGAQVACNSDQVRWVPAFSLPAGTNVTDANNTSYVVKPLSIEERMNNLSQNSCTGASLSLTGYTLPDGSKYTAPNIGTEPTVTGAPAVIGGVLQ